MKLGLEDRYFAPRDMLDVPRREVPSGNDNGDTERMCRVCERRTTWMRCPECGVRTEEDGPCGIDG